MGIQSGRHITAGVASIDRRRIMASRFCKSEGEVAMRIRTHVCVVVGVILLGTAFGVAQQGARGGSWPRVGGDQGVTRYAPLDQITKNNVAQLRIAWRRPAVDVSLASKLPNLTFGSLRASPVMVDGV